MGGGGDLCMVFHALKESKELVHLQGFPKAVKITFLLRFSVYTVDGEKSNKAGKLP